MVQQLPGNQKLPILRIMIARLIAKIKILAHQKHPFKFALSRLLRDLLILDKLKIYYKYKGIELRLTRSALSLSLWVDSTDREIDTHVIASTLKFGDVFVDVGAHIGHLSLLGAKLVGESGKVYSIEAHPRTYQDLLENIKRNQLCSRIYPCNIAASDNFKWLKLTDEVTANDQNKVSSDGSINILGLPLAQLLDCQKINLLKVDVEGYEKFVLEGVLYSVDVEIIYFEAFESNYRLYNYKFSDVYDTLSRLGYEMGICVPPKIKKIDRYFVPQKCVNIIAWKDSDSFYKKTGFIIEAV